MVPASLSAESTQKIQPAFWKQERKSDDDTVNFQMARDTKSWEGVQPDAAVENRK